MYEHLNLRAWPFQIVPDPEFAEIWVGRQQTKQQLDRLIQKMQFAPKSGLHLLWANFGMGKTHTLLHLKHLCRATQGRLIPVYAVMPRRPTGFVDLYRTIVNNLPLDFLGDQLVRMGAHWSGSLTFHPVFAQSPGIVNAILGIRSGDASRATPARQWLIAQPGLRASDLRSVGVTYRIKTPEDALAALSAITQLATFTEGLPSKLIIMVDEFQRIGELRPAVMNEVNASLHSYFNSHPRGLELFLSFSFGRKENVEYLLSSELKSRAEPQSISLDLFTPAQATVFLRDLLAEFRIREDGNWAYPFSADAIEVIVHEVAEKKVLTPRRLMLYANHVLLESQMSHGPGYADPISAAEARELLSDPRLGELDTDGPEAG